MTRKPLTTDARNRALRTFAQGLLFTVLAASVTVLGPVILTAKKWDDLRWDLIGFSLFQAAATAALSYLMRTLSDPAGGPLTPPANDQGEGA